MEIGSEFPWTDPPGPPYLAWPNNCRWYALGRGALMDLWHHIGAPGSKLFLPSFFCAAVVSWLRESGLPIATYQDSPSESTTDGDSLQTRAGDVVLALNYFGIRSGTFWNKWKASHAEVVLIEDHTHDPFSRWAQLSTADFAFASIRKTFPTPDGAILWSPVGRQLPLARAKGDWRGSAAKFAAMAFKRDFLENPAPIAERRQFYRHLEAQGEEQLESHGGPAIAPWSLQLLKQGYPRTWRTAREENVQHFVNVYRSRLGEDARVSLLFGNWPEGHCPFNPVLVFRSETEREAVRARLIRSGVFTPIHWRIDARFHKRAAQLSVRVLTIPLDQRCPREHIPKIVDLIRKELTALSGPSGMLAAG